MIKLQYDEFVIIIFFENIVIDAFLLAYLNVHYLCIDLMNILVNWFITLVKRFLAGTKFFAHIVF